MPWLCRITSWLLLKRTIHLFYIKCVQRKFYKTLSTILYVYLFLFTIKTTCTVQLLTLKRKHYMVWILEKGNRNFWICTRFLLVRVSSLHLNVIECGIRAESMTFHWNILMFLIPAGNRGESLMLLWVCLSALHYGWSFWQYWSRIWFF